MGPQGRLFWSLHGNLVILCLEAPPLAFFSWVSTFLPFLRSMGKFSTQGLGGVALGDRLCGILFSSPESLGAIHLCLGLRA